MADLERTRGVGVGNGRRATSSSARRLCFHSKRRPSISLIRALSTSCRPTGIGWCGSSASPPHQTVPSNLPVTRAMSIDCESRQDRSLSLRCRWQHAVVNPAAGNSSAGTWAAKPWSVLSHRRTKLTRSLLVADQLQWPVRVPVVDYPAIARSGRQLPTLLPCQIDVPVSITGRIGIPGERDAFQFQAAKDDQLLLKVESRSLGFPLDPVLELFNAEGKSLARDDDSGGRSDAQILYKPTEDGPLSVVVSDLFGSGGSDSRLPAQRGADCSGVPAGKRFTSDHCPIGQVGRGHRHRNSCGRVQRTDRSLTRAICRRV